MASTGRASILRQSLLSLLTVLRCPGDCQCDVVLFVTSCYYCLCWWSFIQEVFTSALVFPWHFLLAASKFQVFYQVFWSILNWLWYSMRDRDLVFILPCLSSPLVPIFRRDHLFPTYGFAPLSRVWLALHKIVSMASTPFHSSISVPVPFCLCYCGLVV